MSLGAGRAGFLIGCSRAIKAEAVAAHFNVDLDRRPGAELLICFGKENADLAASDCAPEAHADIIGLGHAEDEIGIILAGIEVPLALLCERNGSRNHQRKSYRCG